MFQNKTDAHRNREYESPDPGPVMLHSINILECLDKVTVSHVSMEEITKTFPQKNYRANCFSVVNFN